MLVVAAASNRSGRNARHAARRIGTSSYHCRRPFSVVSSSSSSSLSSSSLSLSSSQLIPPPYSPTTSINNYGGVLTTHRQLQRLQLMKQQQQQQQFRHYLYIPVEWSELKERVMRWVEKSEQRVVNVKLLSRKFRKFAAADRKKMKTNSRGSSISKKKSKKDDVNNDIDDILYDIDYRNESPNSRKATIEAAAAAATTIPMSSPPQSFTVRSQSYLASTKRALRGKKLQWKRRWRAHHGRRRRQLRQMRQLLANAAASSFSTIKSTSLSSSSSSLSSSSSSSALPLNKSTNTVKDENESTDCDEHGRFEEPVSTMKGKEEVDFLAWEARRFDQYVRWKQRRIDQMGRWKRHRAMVRTRRIMLEEYSRPEWFCRSTGRPLTSRDSTGRFVNPWLSQSTNGIHSPWTILKWRWQRLERELKQVGVFGLLSPTKIMSWLPFLSSSSNQNPMLTKSPLAYQSVPPLPKPKESELQCTWVGHATYLMHIDQDFTILVDPVFSVRCSPYQNSPIGVARDVPPSCTIQQLVKYHQSEISRSILNNSEVDESSSDNLTTNNQLNVRRPIDLCCITHDHYDHLDRDSVLGLKDHVDTWVTPLVVGDWLVEKCGIDRHRIVQLEWWEQVKLRKRKDQVESPVEIVSQGCMTTHGRDSGNPDPILATTTATNDDSDGDDDDEEEGEYADKNYNDADLYEDLTITCCPASHWGSRALWDRNRRLWCSFAIKTTSYNVFACGDTSYPEVFPLFRQIGDALGPFDLAALPIGAYEPKDLNKDSHVNPHEAVQIHQEYGLEDRLVCIGGRFG
eukprot:CAMPEP_0113484270 /NCGR_PEP_ID=MMETSP0014_2-20120614/23873_1 /TAXON_ID=2857 /ORGANISM="Nitzschia sp." /LENGTH=796 /DNA_ID=CAMNT_0000377863 /DNA_START=295 /DNA_END=2685 /DNA_ORIENTATION=- /assembly_acc=CAM_ASM_000159